ncbi:FMN reductase (NADPH) [Listeria grayi]|uniref:Putative FMN-containing NADPH-linked nitro/flavin reductase n=1 Tax=Listeria grayi FSL F6-1183 TaxID=1265827 RepID=A0A829RB12_LISGR|nr:NADPH-dependent oxidoreductase [Listeria grayi]EUJ30437.1 putative FMN-containing NADPH-linked nitro/flavin reductase [Listeria grayi FSL F6-1183]VEI31273.1 FMN reductase (NADPH) [Listeria grayi]
MNKTIQQLVKHVSVREFKKERLSDEIKQTLVTAARSGATSHFVQAFSILEITDQSLRAKLAEITDSASYVKQTGTFYVFVGDLYRQSQLLLEDNQSLAGLRNMESLLVAVVDATIAAQNMVVAAESLDLGICYIGGIRNDIAKVAELLNLPPFTIPVFGLTVGVPAHKNQVKTRLLPENQVSENQYPHDRFADLKAYEALTREYYALREKNGQQTSWPDKNIEFFKAIRRPEIAAFLKKQGFTLD